jgi:hypothetical protein
MDNIYVLADDNGMAGHGGDDLWLMKLSKAGELVWQRHLGTSGDEAARGLAVAADGTVVVAGTLSPSSGKIDVGGGPISGDAFVASFDAAGEHVFSRGISASAVEIGGIALDRDDNVLIAGGYTGLLELDGQTAMSTGHKDAFVAKLDRCGSVRWVSSFGDAGADSDQQASAVTAAPDGTVIAVGQFVNEIVLGGESQSSPDGLSSFVVALAP